MQTAPKESEVIFEAATESGEVSHGIFRRQLSIVK